MIADQEFNKDIQELIENRHIKDNNEDAEQTNKRIENIVKSISEKFVNVF